MSHAVLLIGLGQVAVGYDLDTPRDDAVLTHARAFAEHPAFRLVGGVDPSEEHRARFAARYGVPAFAAPADALAQTEPDVVVIAAPTRHHGELVRMSVDHAAPRVILCEKPLSYDLAEARAMVGLCAARGCGLYVNYLRRVAPGVRKVKQRLDAGQIATPVKGVAWYGKGLLHNGSHFVNLLEYWLGPIQGFEVFRKGRSCGDADSEPDVRIEFAAGSVMILATQNETFSLHEIDLVATNGRLRYTQGGSRIVWHSAVADPVFPGYVALADPGEEIPSGSLVTQWHVADQIAASLVGTPTDLCSGADALATLEWLMKVRAAL
ncbi:MAG: Gfo/Idh/MocA family protein [Pigmentiphaga sp.]